MRVTSNILNLEAQYLHPHAVHRMSERQKHHVYTTEELQVPYTCRCGKVIDTIEVDRNLMGDFVFCDACHDDLMKELKGAGGPE